MNRKLLIIATIILLCTVCGKLVYKEYEMYKYGISSETRIWMKKYESLSNEEKKCISYRPKDLIEAIDKGYKFDFPE